MDFLEKLKKAIAAHNSLLCIGLDPDIEKIPQHLKSYPDPLFAFNKTIIDATYNLVCTFKPQIAHYEAEGPRGLESLKKTVEYIHATCPEIPVILDAKRADIGSTSTAYAKAIFDYYNVDAVTVNPYFGYDSLVPFLQRKEKGIIILCRTSNPGASDFQDLLIDGQPLYLHVAKKIVDWHKKHNNCLMVIGATWPEELKKVREITPEMFFLVPGIGIQRGNLEAVLKAGMTKDRSGLIIHVTRAIIYASSSVDFAEKASEEAEKLRVRINQYRKI